VKWSYSLVNRLDLPAGHFAFGSIVFSNPKIFIQIYQLFMKRVLNGSTTELETKIPLLKVSQAVRSSVKTYLLTLLLHLSASLEYVELLLINYLNDCF